MDEKLQNECIKSKLVCRLCLNTLLLECAVAIFGKKNRSLDLPHLILKFLELELNADDNLSTSICQDCFDHLEEFHRFYRNVDQKQKSLQHSFDFLEVKCETVDDEDDEKKDEIPVHDSLYTIQSVQLGDEEFSLNIENDSVGNEKTDIIAKLKTEEIEYSSEDDTPLNELYVNSKTKCYMEEQTSSDEQTFEPKIRIKTKKKKSHDPSDTTPKEPSAQTLILADCELKCEMCNIEIGNYEKLKQHFEKRHRHRKVFIMCCGHKYSDRKAIGRHLHRHRDPDKFKCPVCDKQFFSTNYLKHHLEIKHSSETMEPMKCTFCDREFKLRKSFKNHMRQHEKGEIKKAKTGEQACDQCSRSFSSEKRLKQHRKMMHGIVLPYQCDACEESFLTKEEEDNHRSLCKNRELAQKATNNVGSKKAEKEECICKICCKLFPSVHGLRAHIASIHENIHNFICEQCGKKFKLKASLEKHHLSHQGIVEPPAQCEICGRWLKSENSLRVHRYMHDNSFNKCSLCEHVSTTRRALRLHVKKVHRAEHNFHCQYCEKSFKNSTYLEEHMAIHTGAQLYACPHCGKESRSRSNMYAHVKRMHPQEWLKNQLARSHDPTVKSQLIKLH